MGDLNAQVGSSNENWETVMGTHGLGTMNSNDELFAELCGNHDLVIGGTLFRHSKLPECLLIDKPKIKSTTLHSVESGEAHS